MVNLVLADLLCALVVVLLWLLALWGSRPSLDSSFWGFRSLSLLAVVAGRILGRDVLQLLLLLLDNSFLPADGRHRGAVGGKGGAGGG